MSKDSPNKDVVEAINDLTRVTIALMGEFGSKAEAVRKLHELAIPPGRIAAILAMNPRDVASTLAKAKKKTSRSTTEADDA
jgi:hypothetical protein